MVRSAGNAPAGLEAPLPAGAAVRAERRPAGERPLPRAAEPAIQHAAPASAVAQLREAPAPAPAAAAAEPAPVAEPPPAAIENLDAVATAVIERVEAGGGEARIHLEPAGLGEITIRLHARHDAVHVDVHAETPEAVQLLRDAAADLSSLLGQRGMNLAGLNVGLGTRQGESGGWADQRPRSAAPRDGEFAAILGIEDPAAAARHQRLRAAYNPDGSLLYRV
ncbi:MAG: flagellar hook-length control protein FliK [Tepidiforma sp.]|nr:flagellar hook-length control protein FliK [Tepidiforma sp.]